MKKAMELDHMIEPAEINNNWNSIINLFSEKKVEKELTTVFTKTLSSISEIPQTKSYRSWNDVITVLTDLQYDPNDILYILSRNDRTAGFWTQSRKHIFIEYLTNKYNMYNKINHIRIRIYNDSLDDELMPTDDIFHSLIELHGDNSYFTYKASKLQNYKLLNDLIFGVTISTRNKYAIIPIPGHESIGIGVDNINKIGTILELYSNYDVEHGPLKAIITIDENYINNLIQEFKGLLNDSSIYRIK